MGRLGIARSAIVSQAPPRPPMTFTGAALFQWVNPKAWLMAVATTATYAVPGLPMPPQVLALSLLFDVLDPPCILLWVLIGAGAAQVLRSTSQLRAFNMAKTALLVLSYRTASGQVSLHRGTTPMQFDFG